MAIERDQVVEIIKTGGEQERPAIAEPAQQTTDPLAELLGRAQTAYAAYMQAQKEVATAYKDREQQIVKVYKDAEQQANKTYEQAMERALKAREMAEQQAEDRYVDVAADNQLRSIFKDRAQAGGGHHEFSRQPEVFSKIKKNKIGEAIPGRRHKIVIEQKNPKKKFLSVALR